MSTIFISSPIPNGHSWTITSKFRHILNDAELKYGKRDNSYTILGIEFTTNGNPQIWYPGGSKDVIIQITTNCLNDMNRAVFQVAHEVIHCLFPTGGQNANVLEEGLASHYSIEYAKNNGHGDWNYSGDIRYQNALNYYEQLIKIDSDIINKLRTTHPTISTVTKDVLIGSNSSIPENLATELTKKF